MTIKKGDFIEVDYIARIKGTTDIFDLTKEDVAKKNKIHNPKATYQPKTICIGEHNIVRGIDAFLEGKEPKTYTIDLNPEEAFGKKDPKLIKILPGHIFKKQEIKPFPGLHVNIDGQFGQVKTVSGGRVIVDFNHPLSGRDITYEVTVKKIITEDTTKLQSILSWYTGTTVPCEIKQGKVVIKKNLPPFFQEAITKKVKELLPHLKEVTFEEQKNTEQPAEKKAEHKTTPPSQKAAKKKNS